MVYKTGSKNWYYKFEWRGALITKSTRQGNKRVAEQMESAHRTRLAKAEVGIIEKPPVPTVTEFAPRFLSFVREKNADKPATITFYENRVQTLTMNPILKDLSMDGITTEHQTAFAGWMRARSCEITTVNRCLATLRRMTRLLSDWDCIPCRRVQLLWGEKKRDFVLTAEQEVAYLSRCSPLMHSIAITMLDCGLRPEEVHRLRWEQYRDGFLTIFRGKGAGSRRRVEVSERVAKMLHEREKTSEFVFSAPTKTGHIDQSSYKDHHEAAIKDSQVPRFVPYSLRHTAITNLAMTGIDAPALMYWAGHRGLQTTTGYIHLANEAIQKRVREARARADAQGSTNFRTSADTAA